MSDSTLKDLTALQEELKQRGGILLRCLWEEILPQLIPSEPKGGNGATKTFNDPIWKTITLSASEVAVVNTPLMQRLRRIRQLGFAYFVYPSAQHSRFEHSLGAIQAATRMFEQLARDVLVPSDNPPRYKNIIRMAALMHDSGHPAYSHVGENALKKIGTLANDASLIQKVFDSFYSDPVRNEISNFAGFTNSGLGRDTPLLPN